MATATDSPFKLSSLIGEAGVAANGERLVSSLIHHYPPELKAAMLKRPNQRLLDSIDADELSAKAAKVAGVDELLDVCIRGGERSDADAVVTYALDDGRDIIKGFFPFVDLHSGKSSRHVSQTDSLAKSPAAQEWREAQEKASNAPASDDVKALRDELAALTARLDDDGPKVAQPVKDYDQAKAADIVKVLAAADRSTVVRVLEYEDMNEGRSTVIDAGEKRIKALDDEDAKEAEAKQAMVDENAALKAKIASLEDQLTAPPAKPNAKA